MTSQTALNTHDRQIVLQKSESERRIPGTTNNSGIQNDQVNLNKMYESLDQMQKERVNQ